MQLSDVGHGAFDSADERTGGWLSGQISVLVGLAMMAALAFIFASLATWSIEDPSLSNANGNTPGNAGGFLGSSVADLLMQFTGLASVFVLVAPVGWAWLKITQHPITRFRARLVCWIAAIALSCIFMGMFERPDGWPLPTGLGGVIGDLLLRVPAGMTGGYPGGWSAIAIAILLLPFVALANLFAAGAFGPLGEEVVEEVGAPEVGGLGVASGLVVRPGEGEPGHVVGVVGLEDALELLDALFDVHGSFLREDRGSGGGNWPYSHSHSSSSSNSESFPIHTVRSGVHCTL